MDNEQRMHKLRNGSDTAVWAANEIEQLRERIRSCSTMSDAQKIALVRLVQELAEAVGIDPAASSPADVVTAVYETIKRLRKALEDVKALHLEIGASEHAGFYQIADKALKGE